MLSNRSCSARAAVCRQPHQAGLQHIYIQALTSLQIAWTPSPTRRDEAMIDNCLRARRTPSSRAASQTAASARIAASVDSAPQAAFQRGLVPTLWGRAEEHWGHGLRLKDKETPTFHSIGTHIGQCWLCFAAMQGTLTVWESADHVRCPSSDRVAMSLGVPLGVCYISIRYPELSGGSSGLKVQ